MNKYVLAKQKTLAELCEHKDEKIAELKDKIQRLERAVSVLTGSNPDWRTKVSKGDKEIIEGLDGTIWKGWSDDCGNEEQVSIGQSGTFLTREQTKKLAEDIRQRKSLLKEAE